MPEQETENQQVGETFFDISPADELADADAAAIEEGASPESHIVSDAPETLEEPKDTLSEAEKPAEVDDKGREATQFEYWQSQADKANKALESERAELQRLRDDIANQTQEQTQQQAQTLAPPVKPNTDDPIDIQTYQGEKLEYQEKVISNLVQGIQQEKQLREQAEAQAQQKAYTLGQLQKNGLNPDQANGALEYYSKAQSTPDEYFKDLADHYLWKQGQKSNTRTQEIDKRLNRQNNIAPLGTVPTEQETEKVDPNTAFFNDINNYNKQYL